MICKLIGVRIKELRSGLGLSQEAFAHRIDMARTYFAEVEGGKRNVSARNMLKIANGLGVTLAEFYDSTIFDQAFRPVEPVPQRWIALVGGRQEGVEIVARESQAFSDVPVFGAVAAGAPDDPVVGNGTFPVPTAFIAEHPNAFLLKVSGESMNRVLPNGSLALVDPCSAVDSENDLYVVATANAEATVKRVRLDERSLTLLPDSNDPSFEPIVFNSPDIDQVTVIGRVIKCLQPAR